MSAIRKESVSMKRVALAVLLCFTQLLSAQTPSNAGVVYGNDHAFSIRAPSGWVLDNTAGRSQGLHAVLYEEGKSWEKGEAVMYANTASKRISGQETLRELMAYDLKQFAERAPHLKAKEVASIKAQTATATVVWFEGDQHGNFEAVAYFDEKHTIVMLVLTARTKQQFDAAYPAFKELVGSYRFLTSNVSQE